MREGWYQTWVRVSKDGRDGTIFEWGTEGERDDTDIEWEWVRDGGMITTLSESE